MGPSPVELDRIILHDGTGTVSWPTDAAAIEEVNLVGDVLRLRVTHGGGCAHHDFKLYGCTSFMESYPTQTTARLSHDAHSNRHEAFISKELRFDISPLKRAYQYMYHCEKDSFYIWIYEPGASEPLKPPFLYEF